MDISTEKDIVLDMGEKKFHPKPSKMHITTAKDLLPKKEIKDLPVAERLQEGDKYFRPLVKAEALGERGAYLSSKPVPMGDLLDGEGKVPATKEAASEGHFPLGALLGHNIGGQIGGAIGESVGGPPGALIGSAIGGKIQDMISEATKEDPTKISQFMPGNDSSSAGDFSPGSQSQDQNPQVLLRQMVGYLKQITRNTGSKDSGRM